MLESSKYFTSVCSLALSIIGCHFDDNSVSDREELVQELIAHYEARGALEYIDPSGAKQAFKFTSLEAEAEFLEELETHGLEFEHDQSFRNMATEWICEGTSSHGFGDNLVQWTFSSTNNSARIKKAAYVDGHVYHPGGDKIKCSEGASASYNTCSVYTTIESGYNSSVGFHRCCEKKNGFSSWKCTSTFATSDSL